MKTREAWGRYESTTRGFTVGVPPFWRLVEIEEQLEIYSKTEDIAVIISSFSAKRWSPISPKLQIRRFLSTVKARDAVDIKSRVPNKASVEYTDAHGARWFVMVLAKGTRFLLATCNTDDRPRDDTFERGRNVVRSLRFVSFAHGTR